MTVRERDRDAVERDGLKPVNWIADKARFGLLSISNHGRPGCLEALNRVANGLLIQGSHRVWRDPACCELPHCFDEFGGSWNAANRLGGNRHAGNPSGGTSAVKCEARSVSASRTSRHTPATPAAR